MFDEVVDLHDVGMVHPGQGLSFGLGGLHRIDVRRVHQTLENHPAVVQSSVDRQVDPAQAAMGQTALHLVLFTHQFATGKLGDKRVARAASCAEALGSTRLPVLVTPDRPATFGVAAEPAWLRNPGVGQDRGERVGGRDARHRYDACAEPAPVAGGFRSFGSRVVAHAATAWPWAL